MSQQAVTIPLSDEMYEELRHIAETSDRSLEEVVRERLDLLFPQSEMSPIGMDDLSHYDDSQLWAVVHRRMRWRESARLHELSQSSKSSALPANEQTELDRLLEQVDRDLLLRSEALRLLKTRGYNVDDYFTSSN